MVRTAEKSITLSDLPMPANPDAEKTILGAVLQDPEAFDVVKGVLIPADFSLDSHKRIAAGMGRLVKSGHAIDLVTLVNELMRTKEVETVGGVAYIASLTEGLPRRPVIGEYVQIVKERSQLREIMNVCGSMAYRASEAADSPVDILTDLSSQAAKKLEKAISPKERTLDDQIRETMDRFYNERQGVKKTFVPAGFELIDAKTGGYALGELTVIAARPKVGKSVLLRQGIYDNCERGNHCHLISPEMDEDKVLRLLAARKAGLPWKVVRHPETMNAMQMDYLIGAMSEIADWPLTLDCSYPITATEAIARAARIKSEKNTQLLGLDYLQKLDWGTDYKNRFAMIGDAWVGFANLAKTGSQMAVVVISSLTMPTGKHLNDPPTADEMRGSGEGKYEVSTLYMIHRKTDPETQKKALDGQFITGLSRFDEDGSQPFMLNPDLLTLEPMR